MPTYQYQCRDCGHAFETFQKFSDDPLTKCPACNGSIQRVIQNVGVVFKGSGWYITDSRKPAEKAKTPETGDSGATKPAEPAKTKPESPKTEAAKPATVAAD